MSDNWSTCATRGGFDMERESKVIINEMRGKIKALKEQHISGKIDDCAFHVRLHIIQEEVELRIKQMVYENRRR
jgi:hypothetical protein